MWLFICFWKNIYKSKTYTYFRWYVLKEVSYNRKSAIKYAGKWAYKRNPKYYNYDSLGGDCTNFISQCIYAGSKEMNYSKTNGWYYKNGNDKSPSWTGVDFLYKFLTTNKQNGPRGKEVTINEIELADIAQLSFDGKKFAHTLLIVNMENKNSLDGIYTSSHTFDSFNRRLSTYKIQKIRFVHIDRIYKY